MAKWIICRSKPRHNPRTDVCLMVVEVADDQKAINAFNDWLWQHDLCAYKYSYKEHFEGRQTLPDAVPFDRNMEVKTSC